MLIPPMYLKGMDAASLLGVVVLSTRPVGLTEFSPLLMVRKSMFSVTWGNCRAGWSTGCSKPLKGCLLVPRQL